MSPVQFVPDDDKMRELILLIAQESEGDAPFGATKLNKLLFYIDFQSYVDTGHSITGHEYQRLPNGPAPKRLVPIIKHMQSQKDCVIAERQYFGRTINRAIPLRTPNLELFTAREVDLVHRMVKSFWGMDAKQMSDKSHRFLGWSLAEDKDIIPYNVALVSRGHRCAEAEIIAASLAAKASECLNRAQTAG